jgi:hypothetical protein
MHPPATAPRFEPGCRRARYGPQGPGRKAPQGRMGRRRQQRDDACCRALQCTDGSMERPGVVTGDGWMDGDRDRVRSTYGRSGGHARTTTMAAPIEEHASR